ncbi:MAG: hypothetical protein JW720_05350, partial [Sedimentisphaerales bacterium]|nr:hypothetical protein [Sedimentisphaerales bacterium]
FPFALTKIRGKRKKNIASTANHFYRTTSFYKICLSGPSFFPRSVSNNFPVAVIGDKYIGTGILMCTVYQRQGINTRLKTILFNPEIAIVRWVVDGG